MSIYSVNESNNNTNESLDNILEFLEESGVFIYEDGIVLEGEAAEAYKKRKEEEKRNKEANFVNKSNARANIGSKPIYKSSKDAAEGNTDKTLYSNYKKKFSKNVDVNDPDNWEKIEKNQDKITGRVDDHKVRKYFNNKDFGTYTKAEYDSAYDASRRHARRHPNNESAIFDYVKMI